MDEVKEVNYVQLGYGRNPMKLVQAVRFWTFNILAALLCIALIWGVIKSPPLDFGILFAIVLAIAVSSFIGNLDHFEFFKISREGFEARTRQILNQATTALTEVQQLAAMLGTILVDQIAASGRWGGGGTFEQKDSQKEQVLEAMRAVGLPEDKLAAISRADRVWVIIDYVQAIFREPQRQLRPEQNKEWSAYHESYSRGFDRPSAQEIRNFLKHMDLLDGATAELIADYKYYLEHGEHRRPDVWARRGGDKN